MSGTAGTISNVACYIDQAGIHAPSYSNILSYLQTQYQAIYGTDTYLGNDSQDGQFLAILATALNDVNSACVAVYQSFSPTTAQGAGLSSIVKINGLQRQLATSSIVVVTLSGAVGTNITIGSTVRDSNNYVWLISLYPSSPGYNAGAGAFIIPSGGSTTALLTCETVGAIAAIAQTFTIQTIIAGWTSCVSSVAATLGNAIEIDAALRIRQSLSVAVNNETSYTTLYGNLLALPGVTRINIVENSTGSTNGAGITAHTLAIVVEGGTTASIGQAIINEKDLGCNTQGGISYSSTDTYGNVQTVYFANPTETTVTVAIALLASTIPGGGYTTTIGNAIAVAVAAYIQALPIGGTIYINRLMLPANLYGGINSTTYEITSIQISITGSGGLAASSITLAYNQAPVCTSTNVIITPS